MRCDFGNYHNSAVEGVCEIGIKLPGEMGFIIFKSMRPIRTKEQPTRGFVKTSVIEIDDMLILEIRESQRLEESITKRLQPITSESYDLASAIVG